MDPSVFADAAANGRKRPRTRDPAEIEEEERRCRAHPYGVAPLGNMYLGAGAGRQVNCRDAGLGELKGFTDTVVGEILGYLPAKDLCQASAASRALYAFSHADDLWKPLTLFSLRPDGKFFYKGAGWKQTYIETYWALKGKEGPAPTHAPVRLEHFYSDTLYHPHRDATLPIAKRWVSGDTIARVSAKTLSKEAFIREYEEPGIPVVLTDLVTEWECFKKWDWDHLLKEWDGCEFQCEAARLSLGEFKEYCDQQFDDRPLYLFDAKFCETTKTAREQYEVPSYFTDDLFKVLGSERPDYRWLIAGPTRSGSSFHKDPNSTDAWNACLRGLKKWVFFPPSVVPPGVMCSEDGADVTSPMSLVEWFSNYYDRCDEVSVKPLEVLVRPGEMMFIPNGWWHLCLNLTPTLCITQNYVSVSGLPRVLDFLQNQVHCVSGVCQERKAGFYDEFRTALREKMPGVLEAAEKKRADAKKARDEWASVLEPGAEEGFSFEF